VVHCAYGYQKEIQKEETCLEEEREQEVASEEEAGETQNPTEKEGQ